ncbi:MAG: hypothetical protein LBE13_03680 [Bacteroidales bacterium]|nr:hypothetical protein [Bacteroidales bacterium]
MLYIRMILITFLSLYTSRVVLNELGIEDFGLYSIVGSVVIFLGFINISMSAASQRFLSFSKGIKVDDNSTFNSVFLAQLVICIIILILGETAGIVYIENYLNVSSEKTGIAHTVYQFSLFSFIIKSLTVPYNATIIANEKMSAFAMLSIVEVILQLIAVLLLKIVTGNKLIIYAALMFIVVFVIQICYIIYCRCNFMECKFRKSWNKSTVLHIFSYSGWNLLGSFSAVTIDQGVNMILNSFFGVVVNAARGIAFQISAAISSLSGNFQQALNPQIVKSFAQEDFDKMHNLIMKGTLFSFYLLSVLSIPVIFNMHSLLELWLGKVPEYATFFCQLILVNALISALSGPLLTGAMSSGNIKKYQIIIASINLLNFPISVIVLKIYPNPYMTAYVMIFVSIIAFMARLSLVSKMISLSKKSFCMKVIFPILRSVITTILLIVCLFYFAHFGSSTISLLFKVFMCFVISTIIVFTVGITKKERQLLIQTVGFILKK